jgi:hypothetical protein
VVYCSVRSQLWGEHQGWTMQLALTRRTSTLVADDERRARRENPSGSCRHVAAGIVRRMFRHAVEARSHRYWVKSAPAILGGVAAMLHRAQREP